MTAVAAAPHPFRPDVTGEPGYRPRCLDCGAERHPTPIPRPRAGATNQQKEQRP